MKENVFNNVKRETENLSREKLSKLSDKEIEDKAKAYKKIRIRDYSILTIIAALAYIVFFCCMPLILEGEPLQPGIIVVFVLVAIGTTSLFPVFLIREIRKDKKELALEMIKKESQLEAHNKFIQTQISTIDSNFALSKSVDIYAGWLLFGKLLIDNPNKKFIYQNGKTYSKSYKFSDIINYEVYENGKSKVQGRAGSALIGGAFFGLEGLIVGGSRSRNINEKCNQLKLIIRVNDFESPEIVITYIDGVAWDKEGSTYRKMKENLQSVCSMLEYMLNEKTLEQSSAVKQEGKTVSTKTNKEQLQELKEMLDDGLITQEDFEKKKKQILGL